MSNSASRSPSSSGGLPSIPGEIACLFEPTTIRARCRNIFDFVAAGRSPHFKLNLDQLPQVAQFVADECDANYGHGPIPIHGRMRHFEMDQIDRIDQLKERLPAGAMDQAVALGDLVVVSVLLDAGAGTSWHYREQSTGKIYSRSEGLAVASLEFFASGGFAGDQKSPRVDADRLQSLTESDLRQCLQVRPDNPVTGLEGRLTLLRNLGAALKASGQVFGEEMPRPGNLVRWLCMNSGTADIEATSILKVLLLTLSPIWPGRLSRAGIALGDVWEHPAAGGEGMTAGLVPFHKLSQWLSYSLVEPCMVAGKRVVNLDELTGLPEYRNGGLFIDLGVIQSKAPGLFTHAYKPQDELIVEWRALTVHFLDQVAAMVRAKRGVTAKELPLANILQGGTWSAGRRIAKKLRKSGTPPIQLDSDGTVF